MAYLPPVKDPNLIQGNDPDNTPPVVSNYWPAFEVTSPQYPLPSVWNLLLNGYKRDELVYACIDYRAKSVSEPPMGLYTGKGDDKKPVESHPLIDLLRRPNSEMGEVEFWQATEIYTNIAGFVCWEIETNKLGEPVALWPMNPLWCAFMRGGNAPIRAVRYSQPGNPVYDVPREKLLIFQEFDPQYPMLRSWSRMAAAYRSINVHGSVTDYLKLFFERGAMTQGVLTSNQPIDQTRADQLKEDWRKRHGGTRNWGDIAVLGNGASYQQISTNFKDMAFAEIDGRTEALICMTFGISPILLAAKVGLASSTYSNYDQAMEAYITQTVKPRWRWYQSEVTQQLLPLYEAAGSDVRAEFDTSGISALQQDEDKLWTRLTLAAEKNLITRDEWRSATDYRPIDDGNDVFIGVTARAMDAPAETARILDPSLSDAEIAKEDTQLGADITGKPAGAAPGQPGQPPQLGAPNPAPPAPPNTQQPSVEQMKAWRVLALANIGQPVGSPFDDKLAACKSADAVRRLFSKHWPKAEGDSELARLNDNLERAILIMQSGQ